MGAILSGGKSEGRTVLNPKATRLSEAVTYVPHAQWNIEMGSLSFESRSDAAAEFYQPALVRLGVVDGSASAKHRGESVQLDASITAMVGTTLGRTEIRTGEEALTSLISVDGRIQLEAGIEWIGKAKLSDRLSLSMVEPVGGNAGSRSGQYTQVENRLAIEHINGSPAGLFVTGRVTQSQARSSDLSAKDLDASTSKSFVVGLTLSGDIAGISTEAAP